MSCGLHEAMEAPNAAISLCVYPQLNAEVSGVDGDESLVLFQVPTYGGGQQELLLCSQAPVETQAALPAVSAPGEVKVQESELHWGAAIIEPPARLTGSVGYEVGKLGRAKFLIGLDDCITGEGACSK